MNTTATTLRTILHVDMDAFYASVELLRRPELRGRPVVVGGTGDRGVVAAASYEARSYGVHSAMPSVRARRLCPEAVFLPGDHQHYGEVSARIMELFRSITPLVEPLSLDEAFLDVSGTRRLLGEPVQVADRLRATVHAETGLWCSIGIAPSKFLAKLATNGAKPRASRQGPVPGRGVVHVRPGEELVFLHALPVEQLWGVGPATLAKLTPLGVRSVGDLAAMPRQILVDHLGPGAGNHLHELSLGHDERPVVPDAEPKSISHEETFAKDLVSMDALRTEVVKLSEAVAGRLRHHGYRGRTVQLKVRFHDFTTVTRSHTLDAPTDRGTDLVHHAWSMLLRLPVERGVRLLGIGAAALTRGATQEQLSFDDLFAAASPDASRTDPGAAAHEWDRANSAVDAIRDRFGADLIGPARLAGRTFRQGQQQWGPDSVDTAGAGPDPEGDGAGVDGS
ncbi:MAG: DNA polymerase IV [Microthrixaceae bacterium]